MFPGFQKMIKSSMLPKVLEVRVKRLINNIIDYIYKKKTVRVRELTNFDERFNILWQSLSTRFDALICRDQGTLNWRFDNVNQPFYKLLAAEDATTGELLGYIVSREGDDKKEWFIYDIFVTPGRQDVFKEILDATIRIAEAEGAKRISTDLMCSAYEEWMVQYGFQRYDSWRILVVWLSPSVKSTFGGVLKRENWLSTCADSDQDFHWRW